MRSRKNGGTALRKSLMFSFAPNFALIALMEAAALVASWLTGLLHIG